MEPRQSPNFEQWVAERTVYDLAVTKNESLVRAMLRVLRDPWYDVNKDEKSQHGKATCSRGPMLLHLFARNGWTDLFHEFSAQYDMSPDVASPDGPWFTPLFHALAEGHVDMAASLVAKGADVTRHGNPYGMLHALLGKSGVEFDKVLETMVGALAQKVRGGKNMATSIWDLAEWFTAFAERFPGKIGDGTPLFHSLKQSVSVTVQNLSKVRKEDWDKFCSLLWVISGSSEPPMVVAAKAGSMKGTMLFMAAGFHCGILDAGTSGRTPLMEACAALEDAEEEESRRLLGVAKALLAIAQVNPNHVVASGSDAGKTVLHIVAELTERPATVAMTGLLLAYGADPAIGGTGLIKLLQDKNKYVRPNSFQLG